MSFSRIVVRLPNWLGDIVMALPALGAVRAQFPAATLAAAAPAPLVALLSGVAGVDEVVPLAAEPGLTRLRADAAELAGARCDLVVLFTNSLGSALAAWKAGIPERWGYRSDGRRLLLTRSVSRRAARRIDPSRHHSRYYVRLVRALGIDAPEGEARIGVAERWRERADRLLEDAGVDPSRRIVGIAPGAAYGGAKRWPPGHVARLVELLTSNLDASAVLVGAPADRETGHEIEIRLRERSGVVPHLAVARSPGAGRLCVANLIGRTDLAALAGVMARCGAFVSNDSGAMHLAAAAGVPVTAMFGPTREWATSPLGPNTVLTADVFCRPCMLRECPIDHRCMKRIAPEDVLSAVERQLRPGGYDAAWVSAGGE